MLKKHPLLFISHNFSRGMGIVETIVYVGVFLMIMLAIVTSIQYFYRTNNYSIQQASAVTSAQRGIDTMVRELREAAYSSNGAYPIVSFGQNDLRFYANVDTDPLIEEVHYYVQGTSLMRGVIDPSGDPPSYANPEVASAISDNVRNVAHGIPIFTYYDTNGTQITDYTKIGDVRFISASVQVDVDPNRSPTPLTIRSSAALRNLQ